MSEVSVCDNESDTRVTCGQSPDFLRILGSKILARMEGKVGSFSDWLTKIRELLSQISSTHHQ
jgi:hypothetical protein